MREYIRETKLNHVTGFNLSIEKNQELVSVNPEFIIRDFYPKKVVLRDGTRIKIDHGSYHDYYEAFNPPEWDTLDEFEDKFAVLMI